MDDWCLARKDEMERQRTQAANRLSTLRGYVEKVNELHPAPKMYARFMLFRYKKALEHEERYNALLGEHYYGLYESNGAYTYRKAFIVSSKMLWLSLLGLVDATFALLTLMLRSIVSGVRSKERISSAPGSLILTITSFLYSEKTNERVFQQLVSDMRDEYFLALNEARDWKARWIRVRYAFAFLHSVGFKSYFSLLDKIRGLLNESSN